MVLLGFKLAFSGHLAIFASKAPPRRFQDASKTSKMQVFRFKVRLRNLHGLLCSCFLIPRFAPLDEVPSVATGFVFAGCNATPQSAQFDNDEGQESSVAQAASSAPLNRSVGFTGPCC